MRYLQFHETCLPKHASRGWLQGPLRDCAKNGTDDGALARSLLDAGASTEDTDRVRGWVGGRAGPLSGEHGMKKSRLVDLVREIKKRGDGGCRISNLELTGDGGGCCPILSLELVYTSRRCTASTPYIASTRNRLYGHTIKRVARDLGRFSGVHGQN